MVVLYNLFMLRALASVLLFTCLTLSTPAAMGQADAALRLQIEDFLHGQAAHYPAALQINIEPTQLQNQAACEDYQVFLPNSAKLRPRMSVGIRCQAPNPWVSYVQVNLSLPGMYYVAARTINRDEVVDGEDILEREADLLRLPPGAIYDPDRVLGSIATQRISAGSPLRTSALRGPDSIQRGQAVRLEARGVGFVATSDGKALEDGEPGMQIQVRAASGQTVSGTVVNNQTVVVLM